ncbi:MAG TPA: hypothetical protein GXX72_00010 [Clostridiaceae bacterium]|jgi:hypothetical protein|nr:hypothetical protein [Clostridiaceae bacterium]
MGLDRIMRLAKSALGYFEEHDLWQLELSHDAPSWLYDLARSVDTGIPVDPYKNLLICDALGCIAKDREPEPDPRQCLLYWLDTREEKVNSFINKGGFPGGLMEVAGLLQVEEKREVQAMVVSFLAKLEVDE